MVLVVAEQRDGTLNRASWEAVAAGQHAGVPVTVAILGAAVDAVAAELAPAAVDEVIVVDHAALAGYTADGHVLALAALLAQVQPALVFFPHTYQTRDFAPALAARLGRALVTDVTSFRSQDGATVYSRPVFQG
jgi:electron transfer flavoprotein alpha subunit